MSWCYKLLAGRGETAKVDDVAKRQMSVAGLTEADYAEVDAMLNLLRARRLVPHHPERLRAVLREVGAAAHDGNAKVAQTAIYRGYAAALRQTERRWDGTYVEDDDLVADLLRSTSSTSLGQAPSAYPPAKHPAHPRMETDGSAVRETNGIDIDQSAASASTTQGSSGGEAWLALAHRFAHEKVTDGAWDPKSRKQALQTYGLIAELLSERGVTRLDAIKQRHISDLKRAFGNFAKSYGKSPADEERSITELEEGPTGHVFQR